MSSWANAYVCVGERISECVSFLPSAVGRGEAVNNTEMSPSNNLQYEIPSNYWILEPSLYALPAYVCIVQLYVFNRGFDVSQSTWMGVRDFSALSRYVLVPKVISQNRTTSEHVL